MEHCAQSREPRKTMVGDLAALERKRSIFLLPMRALVNDKYDHFVQRYGDFGIRTIRATGEIADDVPDLMRGPSDAVGRGSAAG